VATLGQDVRYALRTLGKQKAFTALAVLTLALGIGATTTIASFIQNVLFDPFPGHTIDRAVAFEIRDAKDGRPGGRAAFQTAEFLDYQEQIQSFEEVIAGTSELVIQTLPEGSEQLNGGLVTVNNFSFLGVPAALGRTLLPEDALPGAPPVFVLSHRAFTTSFGGDASAIGRTFILNDVPTTLVGVMPPRFAKLAADVYRPVVLDRGNPDIAERFFILQARLKPGVSMEEAQAEIEVVARRVAQAHPKLYPEKFTVKLVSFLDQVIGSFRTTLYTLGAAVGLLLLIACSNVANMLLARATGREREMAVRASLGASRRRLVRQLLVESLVLALVGAALGCLLAHFGIQVLVAALPVGLIPRQTHVHMSGPVLAISLITACATAMLCGLVPSLRAARKDLVTPLKDSGKGTSGGARRNRLAGVLVVAEVALSLVLLAGAGLLIRSYAKVQAVELGLDPQGVISARINLPRAAYKEPASRRQFLDQVVSRVRTLPGVVAATTTTSMPLFGGIGTELHVPGTTHPERWDGQVQLVGEGVLETLGLRLRQGRFLSEADVAGARRVAVVNQTFVDRFLGDGDPLGRTVDVKRLRDVPDAQGREPLFEIVGVLADTRNQGLENPVSPEVLVPATVTSAFERGLLVRTTLVPEAMVESVKRAVWSLDPSVPLTSPISLPEAMRRYSYAAPRFTLLILGTFASVGLALVAVGVFSVVAYTVSRRTQEIGLRMALGAGRADVLRMVLRMGGGLVGGGLVAGLVASLAVTRVLSSHLFGVSPHDPATLAAVAGVVTIAGFLACYFPARRATRVDPMVALRHE
jgi:putative ABC transport system permease protein